MDNDTVAWVGTWTSQGALVARAQTGDWLPSWWYIEDVANGLATATSNKPPPDHRVSDLRGLADADFMLLMFETRARMALGDAT